MNDVLPWPVPGDSTLDKARTIAREYRGALLRADPTTCAQLDEAARRLGQTWITPQLAQHGEHDWITIAEAAELVSRTTRAVRYWTTSTPPKLDTITDNAGVTRVRYGQLIDVERDMRERRAARTT